VADADIPRMDLHPQQFLRFHGLLEGKSADVDNMEKQFGHFGMLNIKIGYKMTKLWPKNNVPISLETKV
jgi:hypothetical protein